MIKTDFSKLEETKHMLEWLADDPFDVIVYDVENMYKKQESSAKMSSFKVLTEPQWLTGARKTEDENQVIVVRVGVAFETEFELKDRSGTYLLKGVFSWVGTGLDTHATTKIWMDLDGTLEEFGSKGELQNRLYELDK